MDTRINLIPKSKVVRAARTYIKNYRRQFNQDRLPDQDARDHLEYAWMILLREEEIVLTEVPTDERTYDICLLAVKINGHSIEAVPDELITDDICLAAIKTNCTALEPGFYRRRPCRAHRESFKWQTRMYLYLRSSDFRRNLAIVSVLVSVFIVIMTINHRW